jgi:hypothetical protein
MATVPVYPVRVEGKLDANLSRWLWLVKWLLAIPHVVVLVFLWIAFFALSVVALFAILLTGRYPRSIFDFNVGVLRWTWRVAFYSYSALGTDRYPPFTLGEAPDYPATLEVAYPARLSRGLALVKWWLLAIPHYLVVGIFVGGGTYVAWQAQDWRWGGGIGLIGLLVVFAAAVLLVAGRYPRGIFDLVLGLDRWALRVAAYAALMTDSYPPFRLDLGGAEPGAVAVGPAAADVDPRPGGAAPATPWGTSNVVLVVIGSVVALLGFLALAGGGALVGVDQTQRDRDGFVMSPSERFATGTHAVLSESVALRVSGPDWVAERMLGTVRVRSESRGPVFVGIAREADVQAYLGGVSRSVVTDFSTGGASYDTFGGGAPAAPPAAQEFWVASAAGAGEQVLEWEVRDGTWNVVLMNANGSPVVAADLSIGAELDGLLWFGLGLVGLGLALGAVAAIFLYVGVPRSRGA